MDAAEVVLLKQPSGSVPAILDMALTEMIPDLAVFIQAHSGQAGDPIRKLAIIGVSSP